MKFRVMNDEGDFVDMGSKEEANATNQTQEADAGADEAKVEAEVQEQVQTEVQEQVQEVLEESKNEQDGIQQETKSQTENKAEEVTAEPDLDESRILQHLKERYNAQFETLDDVLKNNEKEQVQLSEDIQKYMEYQKETGRGLEDFMRLQQDVSNQDDMELLQNFYKETKPYLEAKDVPEYIQQNFSADEDAEDREKKQKELAYKEELYNARKYFNDMKERYRVPLESSVESIPEDYRKAYDEYNNYISESEKAQKATQERATVFSQKTEQLFSENFKGFEYDVGDKKLVFKPKDVTSVKETQSNLNNYIDRFLDKSGYLSDAEGYHRSLNMALNPDAVAKFFYEQGVADATEGLVKETKNIDMDVRSNKETESKGGFKYRILDNSDSTEFKIRKK